MVVGADRAAACVPAPPVAILCHIHGAAWRYPAMKPCLLIPALAITVACGDGGAPSEPGVDGSLLDAMPDAGPYTGPSLSPVGVWQENDPTLPPTATPFVYRFEANGAASLTTQGGTTAGTWELVADGRLHTVIGDFDDTQGYFATPDRYYEGTLTPSGPVSGLAGTWNAKSTHNGTDFDVTLVLAADHTLTHIIVGGPAEGARMGTWSFDGDHLHITEDNVGSFIAPALPGVVIANHVYDKIGP